MLGSYTVLPRRVLAWIFVLGLVLAWGVPAARAATAPWNLTELTLRSDVIVRGQVVKQSSFWNEQHTTILTDTTLDVMDVIRGEEKRRRVVVRTPGGVVGGVGLRVEPAPHFAVGEEALLFLKAAPAGVYRVVGSVQGKYTLRNGWAINERLGVAQTSISVVKQVIEIMDAHGIESSLRAGWQTQMEPPAVRPSSLAQPQDFVYQGYHWPGPNPMGEDYLVNVNTADVPSGPALDAIQSAADTWTAVSGANFAFTYGGSSEATDKANDETNDITWKNQGDTGTLATTWIWFWSNSKEIFESDMVINDFYKWDTSGAPAGNEYDLQSVALHEFGHYLHLNHDSNSDAVMFASISSGTTKRALHQNDVDGIRFIYPDGTLPTSTPTTTLTRPPTATHTPTLTPTSTRTPTATPTATVPSPCLADFDGNGIVSLDEVTEIVNRWHLTAADADPDDNPTTLNYDPTYDVNGDLVIDVLDVAIGTSELNQSCE